MHVLKFVASYSAAPLDLVAERFFQTNPQTQRINTAPVAAAKSRLHELALAGYVRLSGASVAGEYCPAALITPRGARKAAMPFRAPPRMSLGHLLATAKAIERVRARFEPEYDEVELKLERQLLSDHAKRHGFGGAPSALPDALVVARHRATGKLREIPIEYVTSKYTSASIQNKARNLGPAIWFADNDATRARVEQLTGRRCHVI